MSHSPVEAGPHREFCVSVLGTRCLWGQGHPGAGSEVGTEWADHVLGGEEEEQIQAWAREGRLPRLLPGPFLMAPARPVFAPPPLPQHSLGTSTDSWG